MKAYFKLGCGIFFRRETAYSIIMLAVGIVLVMSSIQIYVEIQAEQAQEFELYGEIQEQQIEKKSLMELEDVLYITPYVEMLTHIVYEGYSHNLILCGMEQSYLESQYGEELIVGLEGGMPYVIIETDVMLMLRNDKKEKLSFKSKEQYLLDNIEIGEETRKRAKIVGMIGEYETEYDKKEKKEGKIYTTWDGFEKLTDTIISQNENSYYLIGIENAKHLKSVIENIEDLGLDVRVTDMLQGSMDTWDIKKIESVYRFLLGSTFSGCAIITFNLQFYIWKLRNRSLISFIKNIAVSKDSIRYLAYVELILFLVVSIVVSIFFSAIFQIYEI